MFAAFLRSRATLPTLNSPFFFFALFQHLPGPPSLTTQRSALSAHLLDETDAVGVKLPDPRRSGGDDEDGPGQRQAGARRRQPLHPAGLRAWLPASHRRRGCERGAQGSRVPWVGFLVGVLGWVSGWNLGGLERSFRFQQDVFFFGLWVV